MRETKEIVSYTHNLTKTSDITISFEFCKKDLWIGIYWDKHPRDEHVLWDVYICIIPMLPIHIRKRDWLW